jgi:hypothetical protein
MREEEKLGKGQALGECPQVAQSEEIVQARRVGKREVRGAGIPSRLVCLALAEKTRK